MLTNSQIQDLIDSDIEGCHAKHFIWRITASDPEDLDEFLSTVLSDLDDRVLALMINQDVNYDEAESDINNESYLILTDDEADAKAKERANERLADALYEIPEHLKVYFDRNKYLDEQLEDRGALLDMWSGDENYETVEGETYYIYRQ